MSSPVRPLAGLRILVTRPRGQASSLAEQLSALGAEAILIPAIEIAPPEDPAPLEAALGRLDRFDWVVLTSSNAAQAFLAHVTIPGKLPKIAAVGPATARLLERQGFPVDLTPQTYTAEALAQALLPWVSGARILLPRSAIAPNLLPDTLTAAGASVTVVHAYRTVVPASTREALSGLLRDGSRHPDAVTFTSASTVVNLLEALRQAGCSLPDTSVRASIGPVTSQTLAEVGLPATLEAAEATIPSLVAGLVRFFHPPETRSEELDKSQSQGS